MSGGHDILSVARIPFRHSPLCLSNVQPTVSRLDAVTIWTQDPKVFETIIVAVTVDVVKFKG